MNHADEIVPHLRREHKLKYTFEPTAKEGHVMGVRPVCETERNPQPHRPRTVQENDKFWGSDRRCYFDAHFDVHHAFIRAGGYSSQHCHHRKFNEFYVVSGTLLIYVYTKEGDAVPCETVTLTRGQSVQMESGVWHRFHALTDVDLIEVYWTDCGLTDIDRYDEGGADWSAYQPPRPLAATVH